MGVSYHIDSPLLCSKAWDGQGGVSLLTYYGVVVIDDSYDWNLQHREILPNCFQGIFSTFYLHLFSKERKARLADARGYRAVHNRYVL